MRSRRCNLRVLGVKEGRETGSKPSTFIAELLRNALKLDFLPMIDRAHRTLQQPPAEGQPPRAFVVKCHYFQEKEAILRGAISTRKPVSVDGDRIGVFPDYTQAVARRRAAFGPAKKLLRECGGVKYGLLYPARLRITTADGIQRFFTDPDKATTFVKELAAQ